MSFAGVEKTENARKVYMPWQALEEGNFFVTSHSMGDSAYDELDYLHSRKSF